MWDSFSSRILDSSAYCMKIYIYKYDDEWFIASIEDVFIDEHGFWNTK